MCEPRAFIKKREIIIGIFKFHLGQHWNQQLGSTYEHNVTS